MVDRSCLVIDGRSKECDLVTERTMTLTLALSWFRTMAEDFKRWRRWRRRRRPRHHTDEIQKNSSSGGGGEGGGQNLRSLIYLPAGTYHWLYTSRIPRYTHGRLTGGRSDSFCCHNFNHAFSILLELMLLLLPPPPSSLPRWKKRFQLLYTIT